MPLPDFFLSNEIIYKRKSSSAFFCAAIYIFLLYITREFIVKQQAIFLYCIIFLFTLLLFIFLFYGCIIKKTKMLMTYRQGGRLARLLSGRVVWYFICFILALLLAFLAQIMLIGMPKEDFLIMSIALLSMPWIYNACACIINAESIPWLFYHRSIWVTLLVIAGLSCLLQISAVIADLYPHPQYESLDAALAARPLIRTNSNIINWIVDFSSLAETVKIYFISQQDGLLYCLLIICASFISFSPIFAIFSLIFLPISEIRRIFIPHYLQTTNTPPCNRAYIFIFFLILIILFMGFAAIFAHIEMHSRDYSVEKFIEAAEKKSVILVDGRYYDEKIAPEISELKEKFYTESQRLTTLMVKEKAELCGGMRANVERFLDWYYSFGTEYLRLGNALIGNGSEYLAQKLKEHLQYGLDDGNCGDIQRKLYQLEIKYEQEIANLKKKYELSEKEAEGQKIISLPSSFLDTVPSHSAIDFDQRMFTSSGVGAITSIIAAKTISKPVLKTAAAALVKLVGSKAVTEGGAIAAGMGIGASIGSVIPVLGTTVGAAVGGLIAGAGVFVGTDMIMLKLDEEISRDDMRKAILEEVNAVCR